MIDLSPKTKNLLNLIGKVLLVLVGVGILLWFFVINPYLIRQEKQRFETASAELEKLSQQIQTKIGIPNKVTKSKSCDRPNLKSGKSPLSCDVSLNLEYMVSSAQEANRLTESVKFISNHPLREGAVFMKSLSFEEAESRRQFIFQSLDEVQTLNCTAGYTLDNLRYSAHLSCGGSARVEHYPVEE